MSPYNYLLKPLSPISFYILMAVSRSPLHAYAIKGSVANISQGSVNVKDATISKALSRLHDDGLIDIIGRQTTGKSGTLRVHYQISDEGKDRLGDELKRLRHALEVAEYIDQSENR